MQTSIKIYQPTPKGFNPNPTDFEARISKACYNVELKDFLKTKANVGGRLAPHVVKITLGQLRESMALNNAKGALRRIEHCNVYEVSFTLDGKHQSILVALEKFKDLKSVTAQLSKIVSKLHAPAHPFIRVTGPHDFTDQPYEVIYL